MPEELDDAAITESEAVAFGEKLATWVSQQSRHEQALLVAMLDPDDVVGLAVSKSQQTASAAAFLADRIGQNLWSALITAAEAAFVKAYSPTTYNK